MQLASALTLTLCLSLAACGKKDEDAPAAAPTPSAPTPAPSPAAPAGVMSDTEIGAAFNDLMSFFKEAGAAVAGKPCPEVGTILQAKLDEHQGMFDRLGKIPDEAGVRVMDPLKPKMTESAMGLLEQVERCESDPSVSAALSKLEASFPKG